MAEPIWFLSADEEQATAVGLALMYGNELMTHHVFKRDEAALLELTVIGRMQFPLTLAIAGVLWRYQDNDVDLHSLMTTAVYMAVERIP